MASRSQIQLLGSSRYVAVYSTPERLRISWTASSPARVRTWRISVLANDQDHFAAHFAAQQASPVEPRFVWREGLPLLDGALAHVACRIVDAHRAGDHVLWIGEVEHLYHRDGEPLLFYTGRFGTVRHIEEN